MQCKWYLQHNCRQGGWKLTFGTILPNRHPSKTLTQSHLRLSSVCTKRSATGRKGNTKMEQASLTQNQPRPIATTCKLSQPSVEIGHRVILSTISRPVWWLLRDSQAFRRQRTYLFAIAIHFRTCWQVNKRQRTRPSRNNDTRRDRANNSAKPVTTRWVECRKTIDTKWVWYN
jgi:hypothetical protein